MPITEETLPKLIEKAVFREVELLVAEYVREAQARMAQRIPEIVASVSLRVHKQISIERMGTDLVIHVRVDGLK